MVTITATTTTAMVILETIMVAMTTMFIQATTVIMETIMVTDIKMHTGTVITTATGNINGIGLLIII